MGSMLPTDLDSDATLRGFRAGQQVCGRYVLQRMLGRGGMGVVWLARDEALQREVALKLLPETVAHDRQAMEDLRRETTRSLALTHEHIVRVYDLVEDRANSVAAISMEFIAGENLSNLRMEKPQHCFEVAEIAEWVRQCCLALDYAHERARVVHRDLKPANLMLTAEGEIKVTDFGIARSLVDSASRVSAQHGNNSGTLIYMSPQQALGEPSTPADDIYALGATLYELLTGRPPFYSGNIYAQLKEVIPPSMAARRQELGLVDTAVIPPAWESTVAACLAKVPAQRPQSVAEVVARLGLSTAGFRGLVAPGAKVETVVPSPSPAVKPRAGRLVAAAVLLLLCGAAYWFWQNTSTSRQRNAVAMVPSATPAAQLATLPATPAPVAATPTLVPATPTPIPSTPTPLPATPAPVAKVEAPQLRVAALTANLQELFDHHPKRVPAERKVDEVRAAARTELARKTAALPAKTSPKYSDALAKVKEWEKAESDRLAKLAQQLRGEIVDELLPKVRGISSFPGVALLWDSGGKSLNGLPIVFTDQTVIDATASLKQGISPLWGTAVPRKTAIIDLKACFEKASKTLRFDEALSREAEAARKAYAVKQEEVSIMAGLVKDGLATEEEVEQRRQAAEKLKSEQDAQLKERTTQRRAEVVADLQQALQAVMQEHELAMVWDQAGKSLSSLPLVVHAGGVPDVTALVVERMNAPEKPIGNLPKAEGAGTEPVEWVRLAKIAMQKAWLGMPEVTALREELERMRREGKAEKDVTTYQTRQSETLVELLLSRIRAVAKREGYSLVIDTEGFTLSRVPYFLEAREVPDLTAQVIAAFAAR